MLYTTVFVAIATLSGFASAQNTTIIPCCSVPATDVPTSLKTSWCQAERNTCPELCGGLGNIANGGNTCDQSTLNYTCECKNGTKPEMDLYQQSVPGQMCLYWFDACINATGTDLAAQFQCTSARDSECGNLTSKGEQSTSSSASPSQTASQTTGTAGSAGSATAATTGAASTGGAATAIAIAREYGTPLFAGGMVALFGFAL